MQRRRGDHNNATASNTPNVVPQHWLSSKPNRSNDPKHNLHRSNSNNNNGDDDEEEQKYRKRHVLLDMISCKGLAVMLLLAFAFGGGMAFFQNSTTLSSTRVSSTVSTPLAGGVTANAAEVQLPRAPPQNLRNGKQTLPKSIGSNPEYHIVFSTGCSTYQDWQSYVFFYQALVSGQPGTVTRIVSGCNEQEQATLQQIFDEQIHSMAPQRFKIHFTPDYSRIKGNHNDPFVYFNKPYGMKHWLENALGFPDNPVNQDAIIILMDPDQLIMRPFQNNDFSNTQWRFLKKDETPRVKLEHGHPMGQMYGFGLQWKDKVNMSLVAPPHELPSPVDQLSRIDAQAGYIVGPPYVATARDMYSIVVKWCQFAPPVHDQYPHLLAEMFAYCLAAAHVQLPHQTAASFMISDMSSGMAEGWAYIDKMTPEQVCQKKPLPDDLPNVLHFCQRYGLGPYFFGKRKLPRDFISCESPLLAEPPANLVMNETTVHWPDHTVKTWSAQERLRNGFVLCYILSALNDAARYYKDNHCDKAKANYNKTYYFLQD